jgi:hypothetical protein
MVVTPVGMKCPDCGRVKNSPLFKVRPERLLLAALVALVAGMVASFISGLGLFVIFVSMPYGYFAGGVILKASGMKRGFKIEAVTIAGMVLGAIIARIGIPLFITNGMGEHGSIALGTVLPLLINLYFWAATIVSTACAVSKIRYL